MNQSLQRYLQRPPRYILHPDDDTLIRVAGPHQTPWEELTEIQNISLSGLAFTAPTELSPLIGELIKIQFKVPGSAQTACYGLVTRLSKLGDNMVLVGVEFYRLETAQKFVLAQSLARKLKGQLEHESATRSRFYWGSFFSSFTKKEVYLSSIALALWIICFYIFSVIFAKT